MIDIHHHCLPGVDDGPGSFNESVEQCRVALADGITTIIATPHVLRGPWQNDSPERLQNLVAELNDRLQGRPQILLGSEYFFAHDLLETLDRSSAIVPLARGRYILVEFPEAAVPQMVDQVFYEVQLRKLIPVIAHPERNMVFQAKPEILRKLVQKGAKTQVTATSLIGKFGSAARDAAARWLDQEMVHFLATDAHNSARRGPAVKDAFEEFRRRWSEERLTALTETNPRAVIESGDLPYDPEPREPRRAAPRLIETARKLLHRKSK